MAEVTPSHEDQIRRLPCWAGLKSIEPLLGGLSNESHLVHDKGGKFVVRFGRDYPFHHVDRARELMTARAAYDAGFAPKIHFATPGVMVSSFIEGKTFTAHDVRKNLGPIAALVRDFHIAMPRHVSGTGFMFWVFHVVRDYARTLSAHTGPWSAKLDEYVALGNELESVQVSLPIIFGHNDLLPANFIDDGTKLWLIDFEYAGFSTGMFDIAGIAANADMAQEQSEELLAAYFTKQTLGAAVQSISATDLLRSLSAMQCAAALREAMWAMVSQIHLNTSGVDFNLYAAKNLERLARALENHRRNYP